MAKFFILLIAGLYLSWSGFSQYENVWAFGDKAGIDFNANPPQAISTDIVAHEGCASICDPNGQLLFYTDGTVVWNRNNDTMPNGSNISGLNFNVTSSTAQGALIVPVPGSLKKYYIFSLGYWGSGYFGRLSYCIMDMNLNGGLGDVVAHTIGTVIDSIFTEHMTAVPGSNCDIWLVLLSREKSGTFKCYNISINGINPVPVESAAIPTISGFSSYSEVAGYIDISPDRKKLAIAKGNLLLYDFNAATGSVSNPVILINQYQGCYGVAFSPDNSKLYAQDVKDDIANVFSLLQFDLSSNDSLISVNSRSTIYTWPHNSSSSSTLNGALRRAPDGKIYCAKSIYSSLGVITQPNLHSLACRFVPEGFLLKPGTSSRFGLPNSNSTITEHYIKNSSYNLVCGNYTLSAINADGIGYIWEDGTQGATRTVSTPGIYWVRYNAINAQCVEAYTDTFKVLEHQWEHFSSSVSLEFCWGERVKLSANNLSGTNYIWQDRTTGPTRTVGQSGMYWVKYHEPGNECKNYADSFFVSIPQENFLVGLQADSIVCQQHVVPVRSRSTDYYNELTWYWGNGDSSINATPQYAYTHSGNYNIMLVGTHNGICPDTAYHSLVVDTYRTAYFTLQPKEICQGEAINFLHNLADSTLNEWQWDFGDGNSSSWQDGRFLHHYQDAGKKAVQLTLVPRACPISTYTDTVIVHAAPKVDLGADTSLCDQNGPLTLYNIYEDAQEKEVYYLWSTGTAAKRLQVVHPGVYWLQISNVAGCITKEHIVVDKDCYIAISNVFTPNGDGVNDYFFPRQLQSKGVSAFRMQILTRWGQKIFEATNIDGRGWDGRFMGQEQPAGVYVYTIEVMFNNGRKEHSEGNVTLLR